ncbi:glycosyltransferase [Marinobacter subterrani]|uniref:Glycosyltransferase involved in cell wall bisynthesis n=1 Tax=Marinobacter subterrani TaxID=1658765 RepID=A0A0J7J9B2_9GAMM|nr:glycosyltransferase [Marinobacter subterrani]KMQ75048.1 Glycosyltransferase involved in cell wall bisynthesis [Marinobacter subterrani]
MRVLQFYRTYLPETHGGVEEAIHQICLSTRKHGVVQRVLTMAHVQNVETLELPEGQVIRVPVQAEPASCSMGVEAFRVYREQAEWADLIHIHYPWPFADLVHLLSGAQKPVLVTYHSDIIRQSLLEKLYAPLRWLFFRKVGRFVATSPNYLATSRLLQRLQPRVEVVPLGLAPESYQPPSEEALRAVEQSYGSGFFLFIGVLRYYKGLRFLIEAAARTGLPVVIAGHGPEQKALREQAERVGAKSVQFAGFVSDDVKQALMARAAAIVFPSCERSEAFGVTLLEGQLHGLPLITCEIGTGTSFVNQHGETGLVVPARSSEALAGAMQQLHENPEKARRMGLAGRERFDSVFSGNQVGERYLNLYRKLLEPDSI